MNLVTSREVFFVADVAVKIFRGTSHIIPTGIFTKLVLIDRNIRFIGPIRSGRK